MQTGIFSRTYEISDLRETFSRMQAHGIFHTQFNLSNAGLASLPDEIALGKLEEIRSLAQEYRITLDALSGTFNMIDPDEDARKKGCQQFRLQCEIASALDIPVVSLCTGSKNPKSKWEWHDDNLLQSSWDDLMRTTEILLRYAEDNDVVLGVETEASNIINTPERAKLYMEQAGSPRIKIIMDGANLFLPEQVKDMRHVLDEAFALLGNDIVLAHAKDFTFDGSLHFTAAGQGILDFPYYAGLLKKYGYNGPFIMHGLSEAEIPQSCRFLEEVIAHV